MTLRDTGEATTRATVGRQVRRNVKSDKVELVNAQQHTRLESSIRGDAPAEDPVLADVQPVSMNVRDRTLGRGHLARLSTAISPALMISGSR
jgi:hypothetical protein